MGRSRPPRPQGLGRGVHERTPNLPDRVPRTRSAPPQRVNRRRPASQPASHLCQIEAAPYHARDRIRHNLGIFVLPDPDRDPSGGAQSTVGVTVASPILLDLALPPVRVVDRPARMLGTPVPKAAIDEDRNSSTRENDVGFAPQLRKRTCVYAVAKTEAVKSASKCEFDGGVPSRLYPHTLADGRGCGHGSCLFTVGIRNCYHPPIPRASPAS
jgi:hypothetical protein